MNAILRSVAISMHPVRKTGLDQVGRSSEAMACAGNGMHRWASLLAMMVFLVGAPALARQTGCPAPAEQSISFSSFGSANTELGQAQLVLPKFDPALGELISVGLHYSATATGCATDQNIGGQCCHSSFCARVTASFLWGGANSPPITSPPAAFVCAEGCSEAMLAPYNASPANCGSPSADMQCPGNGIDNHTVSLNGQATSAILITDPGQLQEWMLGVGLDEVRLVYSASATYFNYQGCGVGNLGALTFSSVSVTYSYCPPATGTSYCFGDGTGAPCPCGNDVTATTGCANSTGVGAMLSAYGSGSVSSDDLLLVASGLVPGNPALMFSGLHEVAGGAGLPFGDGLRCVGGGVVRFAVAIPDPGGLAAWGPGLAAAGQWQPGDTRRFQVWYRDPGLLGCQGHNLSNGVEIQFH